MNSQNRDTKLVTTFSTCLCVLVVFGCSASAEGAQFDGKEMVGRCGRHFVCFVLFILFVLVKSWIVFVGGKSLVVDYAGYSVSREKHSLTLIILCYF